MNTNMNNSTSMNNANKSNNNNNEGEDVEYYPRHKRAPYLHDISDFGIRPSSSGDGTAWDLAAHGEDPDHHGMLPSDSAGSVVGNSMLARTTPTKSASSSNLSSSQNIHMARRSSFARVFGLGMSAGPIAEDNDNVAGDNVSSSFLLAGANSSSLLLGGDESVTGLNNSNSNFDDSETNPNHLLPPRFRRGSSADVHGLRRMSGESARNLSTRERLNSEGNINAGNNSNANANAIPRWAFHDPSSIVMKDGHPIPMGTLLHHHSILNGNSNSIMNQQSNNNAMGISSSSSPHAIITPTWRIKDRMKTVGVALVLALNIGTDPPDLDKPAPCAKLQCWIDPTSISRAKAKERIGERLEQQYAKWQQRSKLKYRRALDPTMDQVKDLCLRMRESAGGERVLLHYNGHGVPRPTPSGEIWLFDKHHTNYIPLSVTDLRRWLGKPSVIILDCSGAGVLMPFFAGALSNGNDYAPTPGVGIGIGGAGGGGGASSSYNRMSGANMSNNSEPSDNTTSSNPMSPEYLKAIRDTIVLCPTAQGEWLPLNPDFPADIFTSCLTTPIPIALKWFVHQNPLSTARSLRELESIVDAVPGKLTDRKTPLGELNWIFTAITDTIAWNVLPGPLFQRLFRQDLLVASMFRNFLLADRILRSLNCSPSSLPELPSTCHHPLWQAWDLAVETCLTQLTDAGYLQEGLGVSVGVRGGASSTEEDDGMTRGHAAAQQPSHRLSATPASSQGTAGTGIRHPSASSSSPLPDIHAPFFAEQLTAFEIWLEWASAKPRSKLVVRRPPTAVGGTPLPFLQNSQDADIASHELDPPQELPIVLQVLLSQAHRVRALVLLRRFLDLGPSAVNLALSVGIFPYVLKLLQSPIDEYKHVLIGIWSKVVGFDSSCQEDVVKDRALPHFIRHLEWGLDTTTTTMSLKDASEQRTMAAFILSVICFEYPLGQNECINEKLHTTINSLLQLLESPDESVERKAEQNITSQFRMWLLLCLGNLAKDNASAQRELYGAGLHFRMIARLGDEAPDVRVASCYALGYLIGTRSAVAASPIAAGETTASVTPSALPSILHQQLQPPSSMQLMQQQQAPQAALNPTAFQQGPKSASGVGLMPGLPGRTLTGGIPLTASSSTMGGMMNAPALAPKVGGGGLMSGSTLLPTLGQTITAPQRGQQLRPQSAAANVGPPGIPSAMVAPQGGIMNLMPGSSKQMMFSNLIPGRNPSNPATMPQPPQPQQPDKINTVYDDDQRMNLDLSVAIKLAEATTDASPTVRFEAILALNRFIGKYLEAFVSIAEKNFRSLSTRSVLGGMLTNMPSIPMPVELAGNADVERQMSQVWAAVYKLHGKDPFPLVRELVLSIVMALNKHVMRGKAKLRQLRGSGSRRRRSTHDAEDGEFTSPPTLAGRRNATGINLSSYSSQQQQQERSSSYQGMQRAGSVGANGFTIGTPDNISPRKGYNQTFPQFEAAILPVEEYLYPDSKVFAWKKIEFGEQDNNNNNIEILDPLSDRGAMSRYRRTRNKNMQQKSHLLKESFAVLAERPMRMSRSPYAYDESDAAAGMEKEADLKKDALQLQQVSLFQNSGGRSTSLLRFHPYEPALVVCSGNSDNVSLWNAQTGERMSSFSNSNPKSTRMTAALWVNEASTNLLLTGSSDGIVRIFDGLFEPNDEISRGKPSLISSFAAAPDIVKEKRVSGGLVLEFQQCGGQLIAGGNTKVIRCWDVATEKCRNTFKSKSDASLTTLTTAWDYDLKSGYSGLGPDIIVAGYGNGSLRVFDTRSNQADPVLYINEGLGRHGLPSRRRKHSEFDEHMSWIVDVSFTTYGGRHEIVSGCIAGSIKFWDLRYSSSVRTIDHKMQVTALAAHSNVPVFATGSPKQFIKIMSHDGMTQQVIRYHEKISGQRIGPVSCLSFHPHMPFLAAGFADDIVSLYAPKGTVL